MSLSGPILVVTDRRDRKLTGVLSAAGAFPVLEAPLAGAAKVILSNAPSAVLFADSDVAVTQSLADSLTAAIDSAPAPFMPVMALVKECGATILDVLPIEAEAPLEQVVARLAAALRVRSLHATVLRRIDTLRHHGADVPSLPPSDPLDDATVLVAGRGRTYPALCSAVGERVGLIGALDVETAAHHLNNRDVDGLRRTPDFATCRSGSSATSRCASTVLAFAASSRSGASPRTSSRIFCPWCASIPLPCGCAATSRRSTRAD
jgi:hypothetical protein